ncbi:MAG: pyridoxal phosphate-dependent aminotransferase [bacterium]
MIRSLSHRAEALTDSLPLKISAKAKRLASEGRDIANLTVGEPDFPSPAAVKNAAIEAIHNNFTHYTPSAGIPALRLAVANRLKEQNGLTYEPEQIVICNGAKQAIASTLLAVVNPGDEVIVPLPGYASYVDLVRLAGGEPVILETREDEGWRVTPQALRATLTKKTVAVILNQPHNPTGAAWSPEEVEAVGKVLAGKNIWLIADEIYEVLRYDGKQHLSFASLPGMQEQTALINGVSKAYAMTGWRIGWLAAPPDLAEAVGKVQSQVTGSPNAPAQKAALQALLDPGPEPKEMVKAFAHRAQLISEMMARVDDIHFHPPEGAFYVFVNVENYFGRSANGRVISTSMEMCEWLLDAHGLAIIPGTAFGREGYVRFSFAASETEIREAVHRFSRALADMK